MEKEEKHIISKRTWVFIFIFIATILVAPIIFVLKGLMTFIETGQIGDTIGGVTAPFINIGAALLVYLAFLEQKRSNDTQAKSLKETQRDINQNRFHEKINLLYDRYADFMTFSNDIIVGLPNQTTEEIRSISNNLTIYFNKCDFILAYLCEFIDSYLYSDEKEATMEDIRLLTSITAMYSFRIGELHYKLDGLIDFAGESWKTPCKDLHMHCYLFKGENGAEERLLKFGLKIKNLQES